MPTFIEKLVPRKASKNSGIQWIPEDRKLVINTDRSRTVYTLSEFPADEGRGFHLEKQTPGTDKAEEAYSCFLPTCGDHSTCECRGHAAHGHCKHLDAIAALFENRWL